MCSIIGSFNTKKLIHLYELNSYRGTHSYSITAYDYKNKKISLVERHLGEMNFTRLNQVTSTYPNHYYIVHSQAPTTENFNEDSIHPACVEGSLLWHNGILKPKTISYLQEVTNVHSSWDTELLLHFMINKSTLSEIDGSFACMMYHQGKLFMFRNEITPLFIDFDMNISSTKFETSLLENGGKAFSVRPNTVFKLDLFSNSTIITSTFTTKNNPYLLEI